MAAAHRSLFCAIPLVHQMLNRFRVIIAAQLFGGNLKQTMELLFLRVFNFNAIGNSSQERFIDKIGRIEIGFGATRQLDSRKLRNCRI